jgi:hypothetical protein
LGDFDESDCRMQQQRGFMNNYENEFWLDLEMNFGGIM